MRKIGQTEHGTLIIEITRYEWSKLLVGNNSRPDDSFPAAVKSYRQRTGLSQAYVARQAGVSRNYLSQIERGVAENISLEVYRRISTVICD